MVINCIYLFKLLLLNFPFLFIRSQDPQMFQLLRPRPSLKSKDFIKVDIVFMLLLFPNTPQEYIKNRMLDKSSMCINPGVN